MENFAEKRNLVKDFERSLYFSGRSALIYKVTTKYYRRGANYSRTFVGKETETKTYPLKEVTTEELQELRNSGKPGFVLKIDGTYYYTEIDRNVRFPVTSLLGTPHRCAEAGKECRRLSTNSDEKGGCAKVRACSCNIERFDFIASGYETFNIGSTKEVFVVGTCSNYEKCPPRKKYTLEEIKALRDGLNEYIWEAYNGFNTVNQAIPKSHMVKI